MKIALVIVTFNRLLLLKRLLSNLKPQSDHIDYIIVVNNNSTDGTSEWLVEQEHLIVINQRNSGPSGGFYNGMKKALEMEVDYIWVMDDDGFPHKDSISELTKYCDGSTVLASTCISDEDDKTLSFKYTDKVTREEFFDYATLQSRYGKIINDWASPYNSLLFPASILRKNGLPNKSLFMWGDEVEYFFRLRKQGVIFKTVLSSIQYHPLDRQFFEIYKGISVYTGAMNWKAYCLYRNAAYLARDRNRFFGIKGLIYTCIYNYKRKKAVRATMDNIFIIKAYAHGIMGYLNKNIPF